MVRLAAVLVALSFAGCTDHICGLVGCDRGLSLTFAGGADGKTYDLELSVITTTPEVVPIMNCAVSHSGDRWSTLCASNESHYERGNAVVISDTQLENVLVTISVDGTQADQRMFAITYDTSEINGPGCGTCTSARIDVALP